MTCHCRMRMITASSRQILECEICRPGPSSVSYLEREGLCFSNTFVPAKTRNKLNSDRPHAAPTTCQSLRPESATPPATAQSLSSGSPNAICVNVIACVLESVSAIRPFSLTLEAFFSDSINLEIMSGESLFQRL